MNLAVTKPYVCKGCGTINRLTDEEYLNDNFACGNCGTLVRNYKPLHKFMKPEAC